MYIYHLPSFIYIFLKEFYENEIDIKIPRLKYHPPSQLKATVFPFVEEEISKVHSELSKLTFTGSSSLDDSKKSKQVDALLATLGFLKLLQNLRTVVFQNSLEIYHSTKTDEGELSCFYQEICGIFKLPFFTKVFFNIILNVIIYIVY